MWWWYKLSFQAACPDQKSQHQNFPFWGHCESTWGDERWNFQAPVGDSCWLHRGSCWTYRHNIHILIYNIQFPTIRRSLEVIFTLEIIVWPKNVALNHIFFHTEPPSALLQIEEWAFLQVGWRSKNAFPQTDVVSGSPRGTLKIWSLQTWLWFCSRVNKIVKLFYMQKHSIPIWCMYDL